MRIFSRSIIIMTCCAALMLCITSCRTSSRATVSEVPVVVQQVRHDTLLLTRWRTDSVWLHDSVVVTSKGADRWHTRYISRERTDTIYIVKEDSVPCIVTKTVTQTKVENKLKWWQKGLMWLGSMAILLGISCIYVILRK